MAGKSTDVPTTRKRITAALVRVIATSGVEALSVREVAAAADVSIGAVQHHFPTRTKMLTGAFEAVVHDVRARIRPNQTADPAQCLRDTARQLLPLDERREQEARVMLAFAELASHNDELAAIQRDLLAGIRSDLAALVARVRELPKPDTSERHAAAALLAVVDGLAMQHASSGEGLSQAQLNGALRVVLDAVQH